MELLTWAWKTFCDMMPLHQFSYWNFHHAKSFHSFMLLHLLTYPLGFPDSSVGKESACNAGDLDSISGWGRSTGKESALLECPFPECVCVCVCVCVRVCACVCMYSHSVMSNSLWPHGLEPTRFLCPLDFPGKNTGVGCHFFLQGIFPIQGSNLHLLY